MTVIEPCNFGYKFVTVVEWIITWPGPILRLLFAVVAKEMQQSLSQAIFLLLDFFSRNQK